MNEIMNGVMKDVDFKIFRFCDIWPTTASSRSSTTISCPTKGSSKKSGHLKVTRYKHDCQFLTFDFEFNLFPVKLIIPLSTVNIEIKVISS